VIGVAETGSGKTLAFALPAFQVIQKQPPLGNRLSDRGPYALCMSPTRELAMQIFDVCKIVADFAGLKVRIAFVSLPLSLSFYFDHAFLCVSMVLLRPVVLETWCT
jgi:superfamily II DNA/RNA helicase